MKRLSVLLGLCAALLCNNVSAQVTSSNATLLSASGVSNLVANMIASSVLGSNISLGVTIPATVTNMGLMTSNQFLALSLNHEAQKGIFKVPPLIIEPGLNNWQALGGGRVNGYKTNSMTIEDYYGIAQGLYTNGYVNYYGAGNVWILVTDGWMGNRVGGILQPSPFLVTNGGWAVLKAFNDYCHVRGIKTFPYIEPWATTSGGGVGSGSASSPGYYIEQDVQTFVTNNFDGVRCDVPLALPYTDAQNDLASYFAARVSAALATYSATPMAEMTAGYSGTNKLLSAASVSGIWEASANVGDTGNWGSDQFSHWLNTLAQLMQHISLSKYSGPGHWQMPSWTDMNTTNEGHAILHGMMAAPITLAYPYSQTGWGAASSYYMFLDRDMRDLVQDPLGSACNIVYSNTSGAMVLSRLMQNGDKVVAMINTKTNGAAIPVGFSLDMLGYPASSTVAAYCILGGKTNLTMVGVYTNTINPMGGACYRLASTAGFAGSLVTIGTFDSQIRMQTPGFPGVFSTLNLDVNGDLFLKHWDSSKALIDVSTARASNNLQYGNVLLNNSGTFYADSSGNMTGQVLYARGGFYDSNGRITNSSGGGVSGAYIGNNGGSGTNNTFYDATFIGTSGSNVFPGINYMTNLVAGVITGGGLPINVLSYGADKTGSADSTAAIQSALNAVGSGGGFVLIPAGTYRIDNSVYPKWGTTLKGEATSFGWGTYITHSGDNPCIWVTNEAVNIEGLRIDGNDQSHGIGVRIDNQADNWRVQEVYAQTLKTGFSLSQTWMGTIFNCKARQCDKGVEFTNAVNNILILAGSYVTCTNGIWMDLKSSSANVLFSTDVERCKKNGIFGTNHAGKLTISSSYIEINTNTDICLYGVASSYGQTSIKDNYFNASSTNIILNGVANVTISDNSGNDPNSIGQVFIVADAASSALTYNGNHNSGTIYDASTGSIVQTNGNINASGSVSAASFSGSGTNLTGILKANPVNITNIIYNGVSNVFNLWANNENGDFDTGSAISWGEFGGSYYASIQAHRQLYAMHSAGMDFRIWDNVTPITFLTVTNTGSVTIPEGLVVGSPPAMPSGFSNLLSGPLLNNGNLVVSNGVITGDGSSITNLLASSVSNALNRLMISNAMGYAAVSNTIAGITNALAYIPVTYTDLANGTNAVKTYATLTTNDLATLAKTFTNGLANYTLQVSNRVAYSFHGAVAGIQSSTAKAYVSLIGDVGTNATESQVSMPTFPFMCYGTNLMFRCTTAPASTTNIVIQLYTNGTATGWLAILTNSTGTATLCSNTTASIAIPPNTTMSMCITSTANMPAMNMFWNMEVKK